ncbi:MAG: type IV conjugative transfer system protein TraE [Desulfobulbaceae bacterium]|nr:type IV conjugative transfer system protein TraE [Desulfobulbaceae bacterium]
MKVDFFIQKSSNLFGENRLLKFAFVVMAVAFCFNSLMVYRAVKYQRVVLIPPTMTGTVEFVQGKPTETYIKDISRKIVNLATTYSPPTARGQFNDLLSLYTSEAYPEASKSWYSLAGRIEESQVSSTFYMEKITIREGTIEMFGNLVQYAGDTKLEKAAKTFVVAYRIRDGRFEISEFKEKNLRADNAELKAEAETEQKLNKLAEEKIKMDKQAETETK